MVDKNYNPAAFPHFTLLLVTIKTAWADEDKNF